MTNIVNGLSDAAVGVGTPATKADGIQNMMPVSISDQLDQIRVHITRMSQDIIQIHQDMARWNVNNQACVFNSHVAVSGHPIEPLLGINNKPIPNFPKTTSDIIALDDARTDVLLQALGLPLNGTLVDKKKRFGYYIGFIRISLCVL
ncbi:hypothetical protein B9Z19DRAFT_1067878 [Tuber borchii]|uniref:Uncharacterized protein n=1 Tax=Tuber borchii TaxID=42251 RepID=A0A2T6ZH99_TUBBO|nr:hypothetical protein B9Z19DRAFT_1067878 [Tuber borchii]